MSAPPFKLSTNGFATLEVTTGLGMHSFDTDDCCGGGGHGSKTYTVTPTRTKLHQIDPHLHCSVIGTCLNPKDLRKLMLRYGATTQMSDLEIHHAAVAMAMENGDASKAIQKALDQKHAGILKQFSIAKDPIALETAWRAAWVQGDISGGYWALITHKAVTSDLLQAVYGEVHMLSHIMASANRDELKRYLALEKANTELRERIERRKIRHEDALRERDQTISHAKAENVQLKACLSSAQAQLAESNSAADTASTQLVAVQTARRENAEQAAEKAWEEVQRLKDHISSIQRHTNELVEELHAAEQELKHLTLVSGKSSEANISRAILDGRTILYVGGRPSSTPSIRDFVQSRGGEFLHHDGGLETRKGLLATLLPRANLVVFPVDCVDHDSVNSLKRLCERHMVPFIPLRTASLASLARSLQGQEEKRAAHRPSHFCLRHG